MLLELENVTRRFDSPDGGAPLEVLKGVSLRLDAGDSLAVTGPSGSGKSTLLNLIGALDRPTSGRVVLSGRDLGTLSERELATVRARQVGFVFQLHHLLPQCTVLENVLLPTLVPGAWDDRRRARDRAILFLDRVGLARRASHRPAQLSAGERQRAAFVRALINDPPLVLADEPTGSLDAASAAALATLLREVNEERKAALIVATHSPELAALLQRTARLRDGRLEEAPLPGSPGREA
ncbi:MAG: ABC transporter ATP-binding protein [Planctomycetes bacterium]|nr:ABC transporter ATP-binding protein [Planctomycetota bacterium]